MTTSRAAESRGLLARLIAVLRRRLRRRPPEAVPLTPPHGPQAPHRRTVFLDRRLEGRHRPPPPNDPLATGPPPPATPSTTGNPPVPGGPVGTTPPPASPTSPPLASPSVPLHPPPLAWRRGDHGGATAEGGGDSVAWARQQTPPPPSASASDTATRAAGERSNAAGENLVDSPDPLHEELLFDADELDQAQGGYGTPAPPGASAWSLPRLPRPQGVRPPAATRSLLAELAERAAPGREVPLQVQVVDGASIGAPLHAFPVPPEGTLLYITVHAPGLLAVGDLQQPLMVYPGRDSDVLRFGLRTTVPGPHRVTVRAFRGGSFLGEVTCHITVEPGVVTRAGERHAAVLPSLTFDPGEVTLQVLRGSDGGALSFQLLSETCYAPEVFRFRGGDPRSAVERIYAELRAAARDATAGRAEASRLRTRLRNHGVQLWTSAVPEAVQRQFWEQADSITSFTVLGEQDLIPWELLYPLNEGHQDRGFLAEWLPVVRRVFGQDRVRHLRLPGAAFVVPPGSPTDARQEVEALRARLGSAVLDRGVLTERAALTTLIEDGHSGLLHFACHNAFTAAGSRVVMDDGPFDPVDLAFAAQLRSLRAHHPLVFFNACRSAGEIDWFSAGLGWAAQFLQAGAGAFVGTLWPVRSRSALEFADAFYHQLITEAQPLGQASLAARQAIRDQHGGDPTWLAYTVYGSPAATASTTG